MLKLNIYIVEDDMVMSTILKHMLVSLGHHVCGSSATYNKAVYELHLLDVDLVITDIMLTGVKTGVDLGRYIKTNLNIPFIYHSSVTAMDTIKDAMDTCPDAYLFKPVTKASLVEAIVAFNNRNNIPGKEIYLPVVNGNTVTKPFGDN